MTTKSERVKKWRENTKNRIIASMGGKCCICGYKKCPRSLDLHHLNPATKEIGMGKIMAHPVAWTRIVKELRKCVLICSNCHGEYHDGLIKIPKNAAKFNEEYANKNFRRANWSSCPICGKSKPPYKITCSRNCAARKARKVDWEKHDILKMKQRGLSNIAIADIVGVSDMAVRKRLKKLKSSK